MCCCFLFIICDIFCAAAVYTYYRSLSQENRLKLSGKHKERKQARRRRERLLRVSFLILLKGCNNYLSSFSCAQKLQERQSTLNKSPMPQKDRDKWGKVLVADMMSSEESDEENEEVMKYFLAYRESVQFFSPPRWQGGTVKVLSSQTTAEATGWRQRLFSSLQANWIFYSWLGFCS